MTSRKRGAQPREFIRTTRTRGVSPPRDGRRSMRHESHITKAGFRKGQPSKNRGKRFFADTYTREEVLALVDANNCGVSGLRDRCLVILLWRTGLRISEALGLRLHDVDLERGTIRVRGTKTRTSDRVVGIDRMTAAHLRDWIDVRSTLGIPQTSGHVFCCISRHERGNPVKPAQIRQKLHRLAEKAAIAKRVHPHGLRHSFASEMADEGVDVRIISRALGHSNIAITDRYINHINPTAVLSYMQQREAA
jgi:site-specific recombinase XerD